MGTSHSREGQFEDSEEEEEEEEEEELASGSGSQESFHSAKGGTATRESPQGKTDLLNLKLGALSLSKEEPEAVTGPKVKLYHHVGANTPRAQWVVADKLVSWKFVRAGDEDEDDDDDEGFRKGRKEHKDWLVVVGNKVRGLVHDSLRLQFYGDQLRVDLVCNGVWALKFPTKEDYQDFVAEYQTCFFENTYQLEATDQNKVKVYGKDFIGWVKPDAADESIWEDAAETFEPSRAKDYTETYREPTKGEGVRSLTMGVGEHSFLISDAEIGVYRNMATGIQGKGSSIRLQHHEDSYSTPKKGMLMRGESNLMLWSPAKEGKLHASGVNQLDIETGKTVAEWRFEKDGTPIQMRDITNDSKGAQLDVSGSTFLGLDDNRLCRWDMRDRHGVVQDLASPVLNWAEGHQFSRGTNFNCFAPTGGGAVAVGSRDGKVRLYGTTSMRQAKTAFPGLGKPITHIDVTYDGKWILATTDTYMILISTIFIDKDGRQKTGFEARMGNRIAAPRLLKLNSFDSYLAGDYKFHGGQFSFVTESGQEEHNLVVSAGKHTLIWEFRRVKQDHECYRAPDGLKTCYCYRVVPKDESIVESKFMHENHRGSYSSPGAPLVVATPKNVSSFNF